MIVTFPNRIAAPMNRTRIGSGSRRHLQSSPLPSPVKHALVWTPCEPFGGIRNALLQVRS